MKNTLKLIALLVAPAVVVAGPVYKAPIIEDPVCAVPFTGSVAAGYESTYMFRGVDFGGDAPWAGIDLSIPVGGIAIDVGTWYINPTDTTADPSDDSNDELDIYASSTFGLGPFDATLGFVALTFPELAGDLFGDTADYEAFITLAKTILGIDVAYSAIHSFNLNGPNWFHDLNFGKGFDITDCLALGLGAGVGFSDGYNGFSGFNHSYVTTGLTFALTEAAALDLYLGGSLASDDLETFGGGSDQFHGGASMSVSF
ncbi:MAG: TorF family putative porin [Verrucomicrobiota bacterium]